MGEVQKGREITNHEPISLETYGGKVHVEWDPEGAVSPLGQLPFFIEYLKVSGLYDNFIEKCPLQYSSPNAPGIRDVMGTLLLSILSGHHRYAHIIDKNFLFVGRSILSRLLCVKKFLPQDVGCFADYSAEGIWQHLFY